LICTYTRVPYSVEPMPKVTHGSDPLETLRLEDEATRAFVCLAPARGGMATRFSVAEAPVLFLDEATLRDTAKSVRGGIPILFPCAGRLPNDNYEVRGRRFSMKQHGFARNLPWAVIGTSTHDGASATLELVASDATRAQYPFEFALRFTYRLRGEVLTVEQRFENRGDVAMPVQPGLHPYFFVPDASKAGVRIDTDATRARDNVTGQEIALTSPIALAGREVDLYLLDHHPRQTVLHRPGLPGIRIGFGDDQALLVVWTLPGRDFVCVEPWRAKLGALADGTAPQIAPGGFESTTLTLSLVR
jgi:galactose mutarotase-like enzyme